MFVDRFSKADDKNCLQIFSASGQKFSTFLFPPKKNFFGATFLWEKLSSDDDDETSDIIFR